MPDGRVVVFVHADNQGLHGTDPAPGGRRVAGWGARLPDGFSDGGDVPEGYVEVLAQRRRPRVLAPLASFPRGSSPCSHGLRPTASPTAATEWTGWCPCCSGRATYGGRGPRPKKLPLSPTLGRVAVAASRSSYRHPAPFSGLKGPKSESRARGAKPDALRFSHLAKKQARRGSMPADRISRLAFRVRGTFRPPARPLRVLDPRRGVPHPRARGAGRGARDAGRRAHGPRLAGGRGAALPARRARSGSSRSSAARSTSATTRRNSRRATRT